VIHEKFRERRAREEAELALVADAPPLPLDDPRLSWRAQLWASLWHTPPRVDPVHFYGRCATLALMLAWGAWFVAQGLDGGALGRSFLHRADLPFHEFGHVLLRPFGDWLMYLGGSLFQCLLPLLLAAWFLLRERSPFAAAACLWWAGQNFLDVAPYVADARSLSLQLVGEATPQIAGARALRHDWHNILAPLGALGQDHAIARVAQLCGILLIVTSWAWAARLLWLQRARLA
jgi:hypothetical protein